MNKNVINPVGLKGREELQHIQDLMQKLTPVNEAIRNSVVELTKKAANGKIYAIVRENHDYFIKIATQKKGPLVTEDFQYIGGLQNKTDEAYPTYAKALKRLNGKLISIAEQYNVSGEINTFANEHLLNLEMENPVTEDEMCAECNESELDESITDADKAESASEEDGDVRISESGRVSSVAKALTEDDDPYCNYYVLPKGIENVFESIDDIKKKK